MVILIVCFLPVRRKACSPTMTRAILMLELVDIFQIGWLNSPAGSQHSLHPTAEVAVIYHLKLSSLTTHKAA